MDHAQAARVNLRKIAMRKLSLHYSQRALAQNAVVGRNPPAADVDPNISPGDRQHRTQHRQANHPTLSGSHNCHVALAGLGRLHTLLVNPYFHAQQLGNSCS
jgi:hypothetical protein